MKIEEGSEVYAIIAGTRFVAISDKVALTLGDVDGDGSGALSAFAEASFALALALIAISGF